MATRTLLRKPSPRNTATTTSAARKSPSKRARQPAIADRIATSLEEDIVLGRRHPRERLVEQDLCDRFNTHRGDVRLALFELEKKGIVQRIPNRGAIVRDLTPREVREIYAVREELEVMAVRILPLPAAASELAKLDERDMLTMFYTNLHFHRTLFGLCGNACLIDTIEHLAQKVYGIRSYANAFPESLHRARLDHIAMIAALRGARRDELIKLTRRH